MKWERGLVKGSILGVFVLPILLFSSIGFGATFCVSNATELNTALNTAESNGEDDTVKIVQGTYNGNFTYASTEGNSLAIEGGYSGECVTRTIDPANTILDGAGISMVLALVSQGSTFFFVEGLTVQNGKSDDPNRGAGLYVRTGNSGTVLITNNIFSGNRSNNGGGVYTDDTVHATLTNNKFIGNTAWQQGGGAYLKGAATLIGNIFTENTAQSGGGGAYIDGRATLTNNIFIANTANLGGGVRIQSSATLTSNTFCGNSSLVDRGGGAYIVGGIVTLSNNIFTENIAVNEGGGTYIHSDGSNITNNTFTGNTAGSGGGIYLDLGDNSYTGHLYNNIIWNNTASAGADLYIDNVADDPFFSVPVTLFNNDFDESASGTYITSLFPIDPNNLNNIDPQFVGSGNYHLLPSSPCINSGDNSAPSIPATDKDGNPRILGGTVDIGAYEYNSLAPIADAGPDQIATSGSTVTLDGSQSLDPQDEALSYLWTQIGGISVTLSDTSAVQPTFVVPTETSKRESFTFQLTVTNVSGLHNTDEITIINLPTITTTAVSSITSTGATSGGNVASDGGASVTERGVCWGTSANPTTGESHTSDGTGTGSYTSLITGLTPETLYYVRAYATNTAGTAYGEQVSFSTTPIPEELPVADAGNDQVVFDEVTLDGSGSYDTDGTIIEYTWTLTYRGDPANNKNATGINPTVTGLVKGFYDVTLNVTDDKGSTSAADTMLLAAAGLKGDFDGDGDVDGQDLAEFAKSFGK